MSDSFGSFSTDVMPDDCVASVVGLRVSEKIHFGDYRGPHFVCCSLHFMSSMISNPRITCGDGHEFRTSFVHSHRASIEQLPIQSSNCRLGFRLLRHLDECDTAWFASVPVLNNRDRFNGAVDCENFSQLLLCYGDIEVPDKNVGQ